MKLKYGIFVGPILIGQSATLINARKRGERKLTSTNLVEIFKVVERRDGDLEWKFVESLDWEDYPRGWR